MQPELNRQEAEQEVPDDMLTTPVGIFHGGGKCKTPVEMPVTHNANVLALEIFWLSHFWLQAYRGSCLL